MPDPTDNHGLDINYAVGDQWDYNDEMETIERKLVIKDTAANLDTYTPYDVATFVATDTGEVYDGDGTSWNHAGRDFASLSVNGTDVLLDGAQFSGSYTDLADVPTEFPPETHGDAAHSVDYAAAGDTFSGDYADLTNVPDIFTPADHGDEAHTTDYATAGDTFSGSYDDLVDVPSTFAPETHGNASHSEDYVTSGEMFSGDYPDLTNRDHGNEDHTSTFAVDGDAQPPENHGNAAHTSTFAVDGDAQPPESHDNTAHSTNYADQNHDNSAHSQEFVSDGDAIARQIWVIPNGASDPAGAGADDLIFEEEA